MISDYLKHDTVTVHCFIAKIIPDMKQVIPGLEKLKYFSDGAASQYKNFVNLCFHEQDFCISAECTSLQQVMARVHVMGLVGPLKVVLQEVVYRPLLTTTS